MLCKGKHLKGALRTMDHMNQHLQNVGESGKFYAFKLILKRERSDANKNFNYFNTVSVD